MWVLAGKEGSFSVGRPACLSPDSYGDEEACESLCPPFQYLMTFPSRKAPGPCRARVWGRESWPLCVAAQGCLLADSSNIPGGPHLVPGARRLQKCPGQADAHSPSEPCLNTKSLQFLPSYRKKGCSVLAGWGGPGRRPGQCATK